MSTGDLWRSSVWMSESKSTSQITLKVSQLEKVMSRQGSSMTSSDPGWPGLTFEAPNVIVNNAYYLALHVHIQISSENTDDRNLQAWDALREANSGWHDPSYGVIGHGSWGPELWHFEARRQKDGREGVKACCLSPGKHLTRELFPTKTCG